ncbi:uncharacterized protein FA14DRAFT_51966 [Meira miltonrushii]|uniref:Uncharacterized protein n=1 Tax=Meira miltonrushii TaxID=1280837 RepID=A0A316VEN6_9BASI|nr:uncharacterized protein FA14DRAFT_51966 [Meira miltonrushii]PWN36117.1 hypothetical protein FA14DRAFT_51966 [Meira miltonrushii]
MQPWRSGRVEDKKGREEGVRQNNGQTKNGWKGKQNHAKQAPSSISSSPMRQARLKPSPSSISSNSLELLSSPSRGLDSGTDASQDLTNAETQQRFRAFISERIQGHVIKHGPIQKNKADPLIRMPAPSVMENSPSTFDVGKDQLQSLQDILLFVRRLREGCVAANRVDLFTLDVYILSSLLSLLVGDNIQLSSSLPRTVDLCESVGSVEEGTAFGLEASKDINSILYGNKDKMPSSSLDKDALRSLYLLWLSISGGQVERLGGQQRQHLAGSTLAFYEHKQKLRAPFGESVKLIERVSAALARDNILVLRRVLIELQHDSEHHQKRIWQFALLSRTVNEMRTRVWNTFKKAYMHLAIDPALVGSQASWPHAAALAGNGEWVERMLLIDLDVMPLSKEEREQCGDKERATNPQQRSATPDMWDDSVDDLTNAMQSSSLSNPSVLSTVRTQRLAKVFEVFGLPTSNDTEQEGLSRWKDRITTQAGAPVVKLR